MRLVLPWRVLVFEWDPVKAESVSRKHGITFEDAATVFADPFAITIPDLLHSIDEDRYVTIGATQRNRVLVVSHTPRGSRIRLITARPAEPDERREYEQA
jgi:uncharacterized protein